MDLLFLPDQIIWAQDGFCHFCHFNLCPQLLILLQICDGWSHWNDMVTMGMEENVWELDQVGSKVKVRT